jgi:hypothetical protein
VYHRIIGVFVTCEIYQPVAFGLGTRPDTRTRAATNNCGISVQMRVFSILAAIVLVVLTGLTLVPAASMYHMELSVASVAVAAVLLLSLLVTRGGKAEPSRETTASTEPIALPEVANRADAEVVSFLATFQERGRLIDFLMDDISPYADAQVGAAARVVHEGCRAALIEHFGIRPLRDEREGTRVDVPSGFAADEYRLIGSISGQAPFSGTLIHRGWRAEWVKLPRALRPESDRLPTIAPAEVELK